MMSRQTLIALAGALVLGLLAVFVANSYLNRAEDKAYAAGTTKVAVAAAPLAYGTDITADKIRFVDYPNSTLRDDALWQEGLLARTAGESAACAPIGLLVTQLPDSRYAPCAHEICKTVAAIAGRECASYIEREVRGEPAEPKPAD